MEGEREQTRDQDEGSGQQQPIGQQNQNQQPQGQQAQDQQPTGQQSDLGSQESSQDLGQSAAGQASQSDTATLNETDQDQSNAQSGQNSGGFVGSQNEDSGEYLQEGGNPESGFAEQGRGASNDSGDFEGSSERSQNCESDIEGSSDNS